MPLPRPPFFAGTLPVPSVGNTVTAQNIAARIAGFLNSDPDITGLLPVGTTIGGIIPDGTGYAGPVVAVQVIKEVWKPRTLGPKGVGTSVLNMTLAAVVQVRQTDRNGTPFLTLETEQNLTDALRTSIAKLRADTGTPRLYLDARPNTTGIGSMEGGRRSMNLIDIFSVPVINP